MSTTTNKYFSAAALLLAFVVGFSFTGCGEAEKASTTTAPVSSLDLASDAACNCEACDCEDCTKEDCKCTECDCNKAVACNCEACDCEDCTKEDCKCTECVCT